VNTLRDIYGLGQIHDHDSRFTLAQDRLNLLSGRFVPRQRD
jgi:hypothetical protein